MNWRDYVDETHPSVAALSSWLNTLHPWAREHEEGVIEDLLGAAARGELWDPGDQTTKIKPIRTNPEVFEIRHTTLSKKLRFYHGEPRELPRELIALHKHIKTNNPPQQSEITYAAERYISGRAARWQ